MPDISKYTKEMQSMLPQWMKMAKDPDSVGAKFLDVFGLEFEEIDGYITEMVNNMNIDTADLSLIDVIYRIPISVASIIDVNNIDRVVVEKDSVIESIQVVDRIKDFYSMDGSTSAAIIDRDNNMLYIKASENLMAVDIFLPFDVVYINDNAHYEYSIHHIWNAFDEFGLLLGLKRIRGERNAAFKERILDVFQNPANATLDGMKNGIARELDLSKDSIKINELSEPAFKSTMLNEDGTPSKKLISISERINKTLGFTWGNMNWDEAYWHSIEDRNIGFDYLPHIWDASLDVWKEEDFQSGIGDGNDLKVTAPQKQENLRKFKYYVGLRGRKLGTELIHPEMSFKYKITAKGLVQNDSYKAQDYKYTITASEIIPLYFIIKAYKEYTYASTINFDTVTMNLQYDNNLDPGCEIVTGQEAIGTTTDPFLKVVAEMSTESVSATPSVDSLTVEWEDSAGTVHQQVYDTQADFDGDGTITAVTKKDIITGTDLQLGYGEFYHEINSNEDWNRGTHDNTISQNGSLRLIPLQE